MYDDFIRNMPDGLVYFESVADDNSQTTEYTFMKVNKSFEQLIEINLENILGKKITEISCDGKIAGFDFIDICKKADALEGNTKFEAYSDVLNKWYLIHIYKSDKNYFCVAFHDITGVKNRADKINILYESSVKFYLQ